MKEVLEFKQKPIYTFFKRMMDIIFSILGIIVLSLVFVIIAIAIKCSSKGPVFFIQKRIGKNGKVFNLIKFRTMVVGAEKDGVYSDANDKRVTKIGSFLRKTSLDEIPQLFNIFVGHMSFVGPRPVLTYHPWTYEEYNERQLLMFKVRPGITGWAQIHGRKTVEWNKRIEMNVWYVLNRNVWLDTKIFFATFLKVLKNEGNENKGKTLIK